MTRPPSILTQMLAAGPPGLMLAALALVLMALAATGGDTYLILSASPATQNTQGVCFPSPETWHLSAAAGYLLSIGGIALATLMLIATVRRFALIPGTSLLYAVFTLAGIACLPWLDTKPCSSLIVLLVTIPCVWLLFSLYGSKNPSPGLAVLFSLLGWGSTIQSAFLLLMPIFLLGALFVGILRLRTLLAAMLGVLTPYWILLGTGAVSPADLHMPSLSNIFVHPDPLSLLLIMLSQGLTAIAFLVPLCYNITSYTPSGQRQRGFISFINLLGIACLWFMIFDTADMLAYTYTLMACAGLQMSLYAITPRRRMPYLPAGVAALLYITIYIFALT